MPDPDIPCTCSMYPRHFFKVKGHRANLHSIDDQDDDSYAGLVTEEIFYSIFSKFFPLGGDTYSGE